MTRRAVVGASHSDGVARVDPARPPAVHRRGRHFPPARSAVAQARERLRSWLRSRTPRPRRRRSRDRASSRLRLLARLRRAAGHGHLHASRSHGSPHAHPCARARRARSTRGGCAADDRRRVPRLLRFSKRSGRKPPQRFDPSSPNRRRRSRRFFSGRIPRGISSAASISTLPRTGETMRRRSRFWRPIRPDYRRAPRRSTCRSAAR